MKIKYWLIISYLIVMILPVGALFLFYLSMKAYDEKQDLIEYMDVHYLVDEIDRTLQDKRFYQIQPDSHFAEVQSLADHHIQIDLYRPDGVHVYSTMQDPSSIRFFKMDKEKLYSNLNKIEKNLRTYTVKRAVFEKDEIAGIYEITIGRSQWIEEARSRTIFYTAAFIAFFLLTYFAIVFLLNRKLNRPLNVLRRQMTAFAKGEQIEKGPPPANDEIGEVLHHFYQMKEEIEASRKELAEKQREKEFIVASLSHDLKTPLTVIQAYAEALKKGNLTEKEREEYQRILFEKMAYMKQMLDDLSIFTALQSAKERFEMVEVEGEEFFDMLLSGYEEPCADKGVSLHIGYDAKQNYLVSVKHMVRIVDNLMFNAIRHTDKGKNIWLAAIEKGAPLPDWVFEPFKDEIDKWRKEGTIIIIQNEGEGIREEKQKVIFEPFVQGEPARGKGGSSGIGLTVAKMLIENHHGKINLWSKDGFGTIVACLLPERQG